MAKKFLVYCSLSTCPYVTTGKSYEAEWYRDEEGESETVFGFICDDGDRAWDTLKEGMSTLGHWSVVGEEKAFILVPADTSVAFNVSSAEQEKATLLRSLEHAVDQWKEIQRHYDIAQKHNTILEHRVELLATSLRSLILAVEAGFENPHGFPISDIENEIYLARGAYYHVKQESVEGEK